MEHIIEEDGKYYLHIDSERFPWVFYTKEAARASQEYSTYYSEWKEELLKGTSEFYVDSKGNEYMNGKYVPCSQETYDELLKKGGHLLRKDPEGNPLPREYQF